MNSALQRFGSTFGVAVATSVFASSGSLTNSAEVTDGYRPALLACALMALVGAVIALAVGKPRVLASEPASHDAATAAPGVAGEARFRSRPNRARL